MNENKFVIVSTECIDCGGETAITLLDHEPTKKEISDNKDFLGGMVCIRTEILSIETGITVKTKSRNND